MDEKIKQFLKTIKLNESILSMLFGLVTVVLIGVIIFRLYRDNRPEITPDGAKTEVAQEKVGEVQVTVDEQGNKTPSQLQESVTVVKGDNLWTIALKNYGSGYNWVDIAKENKLKNPGVITVGQTLKLPKVAVKEVKSEAMTAASVPNKIEGGSYTVVKDDNLWTISVRAYSDGYKWVEIARANKLANPSYIEVGQVLKLPR